MKFGIKLLSCLFAVVLMALANVSLASQADPTIAAAVTGLTQRLTLNAGTAAINSTNSGTSRPAYAVAGTVWLNTTSTPWLLEIYDGTNDVTLGEVNASANTFQPYNGTASGRLILYTTDTGIANAYVVAPTPAVSAYAAGQIVTLTPANANTGASTLTLSSLSAKNIKLLSGSDPAANAMVTTGTYFLVYNGTNFILMNPSTATTTTLTGAVTGSGTGTVATTLAASIVGNSNLANAAGNTIKGNNSASSAAPTDIAISASQFPCRGSSGNIVSCGFGTNFYVSSGGTVSQGREYCIAMSDQTTALVTGTSEATLYLPGAGTVNAVRAFSVTAPTGAAIKVNVKASGTTLLSTQISIDATTNTSKASATPPVISTSSISSNAPVTFDITQVGSTVAGAGLVGCIDVTF
jgi:hypothetical protein